MDFEARGFIRLIWLLIAREIDLSFNLLGLSEV
jgi:hypothetical protein